MAYLKETLYRKLYNISLVIIETLKPEDKSVEKIKLSVEQALKTLQVPKEYPFKEPMLYHFLNKIKKLLI